MHDDEPVAIYSGDYMESMFLVGLLEASGIRAWLLDYTFKQSADARVMVRQCDVERAIDLVDDFRKHGRKTRR